MYTVVSMCQCAHVYLHVKPTCVYWEITDKNCILFISVSHAFTNTCITFIPVMLTFQWVSNCEENNAYARNTRALRSKQNYQSFIFHFHQSPDTRVQNISLNCDKFITVLNRQRDIQEVIYFIYRQSQKNRVF